MTIKASSPDQKWFIYSSRYLIISGLIWGSLLLPAIAQVNSKSTSQSLQSSEGDGYLLGPNDRVRLDVFSISEFSGEYQVLPNGTINLPQVGAVSVQGKSLRQASQAIEAQFATILQRPVVTVSLIAARPISVAIAGEVNRPGSYTVTIPASSATATDSSVPNLSKVIQLADGVTQSADLRQVQIRRLRSSNAGNSEVLTVNLWQLLQAGDAQQDIRLQDGDSIFIPPTANTNLEESRQLASANLAARNNRPLKISVVGEVNRPGPYTLLEGNITSGNQQNQPNPNAIQTPTVTRAIQAAGGITQSADIRKIQVRRLTRSGTVQLVNLDMWKLLVAGDVLQDLPLQDGDTVQIPTASNLSEQEAGQLAAASFSPDKITVNVVGEVERPGAISVPPNTPLNQAILAAGGFNKRAQRSSVTFIRLNPNGTIAKRSIPINLAQGLNEASNPPLRNNDTVIIQRSGIASVGDALGLVTAPLGGVFGSLLGLINLLGF
jgi:polysaccharide export outer membrane protein